MTVTMTKPELNRLSVIRRKAFEMFDRVVGDAAAELTLFRNVVLGELVQNAVRHGSGRISVEVERKHDRVRVVVSDEGCGCSLAELTCSESYRGLSLVDSVADSLTLTRRPREFSIAAVKYI